MKNYYHHTTNKKNYRSKNVEGSKRKGREKH